MSSKQSELGIGQMNFADYRYKVVEYLPAMFTFEYIIHSKTPGIIASYDTIIIPFDGYVWLFTTISMIAQFLVLSFMQSIWPRISGKNSKNYNFEGLNILPSIQKRKYRWKFFRCISFNSYDSKKELD